MGLWIVAAGLVLVVVGVLVHFGALSWFGRLPGDVRVDGERTHVRVPLTSMILLSVVLTVVLNVLLRVLRR